MPEAPTRLSINLPPKVAAVLDDMADEEGITKTEVIRNALATERFLRQRVRQGWSVYLRGPEGLERLVFPYWGEHTEQEAERVGAAEDALR